VLFIVKQILTRVAGLVYLLRSGTLIERKKQQQRAVALEKQQQREISCCGCF